MTTTTTLLTLSPQQQAIMDWADQQTGNLNVIARAGTGKSSTVLELANRVSGRIFLGAFNKSIADELQRRITNPRATASTLHSAGFKIWRQDHPKCEVDSRKVRTLAKKWYPFDKKCVDVICDAVRYAKLAGLGIDHNHTTGEDVWGRGIPNYTSESAWQGIIEAYDLTDELPGTVGVEKIIRDCIRVYKQSLDLALEKVSIIDFDDMILCPLFFETQGPDSGSFDWVMLDEGQDVSMTRYLIAKSLLRKAGRFVCIGDDRQSIYLFAGAYCGALDMIQKDLDSTVLPLSVTYRCPRVVVQLAQIWVPDFTAHESAPEGTYRTIPHTHFWREDLSPSDAILCRNTRPLLGIAKRLRKSGIPCVVEGNSAKGLISLSTKWGEDITLDELDMRLSEYLNREVEKFLAKGKEEKAEAVTERVMMLRDVMADLDGTDSVIKLVGRLENLFGERDNGEPILRLCTIHRAKGREWHRVYIMGRNRYSPSKWAETEEELQQESNLEYVAVTRAKRELVEVEVPMPVKGNQNSDWWEE